MSNVVLTSPWATSEGAVYGEIAGSSSNWHTANFKNVGRVHNRDYSKEELGGSSFSTWYGSSSPTERAPKRYIDKNQPAPSIAEPCVAGGETAYHRRRASSVEPEYRRALKFTSEPQRPERPEGKRYVPEPYGAPPHPRGVRPGAEDLVNRVPSHVPEPAMPRLSRQEGLYGLRESDMEVTFEREMGQKVRVGQQTYRGSGRAGDSTGSLGAPRRPEDDSSFFKTLQDSPTFLRFCSTLPPKPPVTPHERRAASMRRQQESERHRERSLVASLELPDA